MRARFALGAAALLGLPALYLLFRFRAPLFRFLESRAGGGWRSTLWRWGREFADGLQVLSAPRSLALVAVYSIGVWLLIGINTWLVLEAFHLEVPLTATSASRVSGTRAGMRSSSPARIAALSCLPTSSCP